MLAERCDIVGDVAASQDPVMDPRVQRLHAAAEHLGHLGEVLDAGDGKPEPGDVAGGASARDQLDTEIVEAAGEVFEAGLVEDGDECPLDHDAISILTACGRSRCSTAWTRTRSVSTVSPSWTGTGSLKITEPVSMPSST